MIIRILHEGQYEVADERRAEIERLDAALESAVAGTDERAYAAALASLVSVVRQGRHLAEEELRSSALVVPSPDMAFAEARSILQG